MNDLDKAIAELRSVTEGPAMGQLWEPADFVSDTTGEAFATIVATILNAVLSGALIPATERDAAVAAALERAGLAIANLETGYHDGISGDWHPYPGPTMISAGCAAIRALITQPQSDALAAVRAEARRVERLAIIAGVDYEASVRPCEEDAVVMRDIARLIAADFSYADADAALADAEGGKP